MDTLQVEGLSFAYPETPTTLRNISFSLPLGSRTLLCGMTGSGKSTLLRCLKPELRSYGDLQGQVLLAGRDVAELTPVQSASSIGFVLQDPHQQIVMDTVRAELAFGLENLAVPSEAIHRRIAEIANFFGITAWLDQATTALSGGQKQIVNLASVIAMQPELLLLDEPTSQLDPIATREFISLLLRVNEELGTTIFMIEHSLEELFSSMNNVLYLQEGQLTFFGEPRQLISKLAHTGDPFAAALPRATRMAMQVAREREQGRGVRGQGAQGLQGHEQAASASDAVELEWPLDVKEGRWWLHQHRQEIRSEHSEGSEDETGKQAGAHKDAEARSNKKKQSKQSNPTPQAVAISVHRAWYRYDRNTPYVLRDLSLDIYPGRILGIVGGNGSGKSTLLKMLANVHKPQHGRIRARESLRRAALPQDPSALFLRDSVLEDVMDYSSRFNYTEADALAMLERLGLSQKRDNHPFDLSGGEQQKSALAKLLLTDAQLLLLDEPTKGIDAFAKQELAAILQYERNRGTAVVIVSHDLEFVAHSADTCVMLFDGGLVGEGSTNEFFTGNMFYTTAEQRIFRGIG